MKPQQKPNVLIIHTDEHRIDCLGAYGNNEIKTPNIDKLAQDGVLYSHSFCPLPVCTPSRYSLLTGVYPHQHMGWTNHSNVPEALRSFPELLRETGYRTKAVGKMHFAPTYLDIGFDELELAEQNGPGRWDDDYHRYLKERGVVDFNDMEDQVGEYRQRASKEYFESVGAMKSNLDEKDHKTTWIADRAMEELNKWGEEGNLLMIGFINPHHPFDPPARWSEMYNPGEISLLPGWTDAPLSIDTDYHPGFFKHETLTEDNVKKATAYYYACISQIDHHAGRMIELLKEKGIYDNTMIIFTSDHGDYMGYHHMLLKQNHMYDPLMKVPLIIKYPGSRLRGTEHKLVNNVDLAPTILQEIGIEPAETMNGLDLTSDQDREYVFAETIDQKEYMVRSHKYKLLYNKNKDKSLFFDLEKDPYETRNVIDEPEYRTHVETLKDCLLRWMLFDEPTPPYYNPNAKVIQQPNVPANVEEQRVELRQYFKSKMEELQNERGSHDDEA